jgi:hypothetical protein
MDSFTGARFVAANGGVVTLLEMRTRRLVKRGGWAVEE